MNVPAKKKSPPRPSYDEDIRQGIAFAGADHGFYLEVKAAAIMETVCKTWLEGPVELLDIGCGPGLMHGLLERAKCRITGLDPDGAMLDLAASSNPGTTYIRGSAENLPFADNAFDVVTAVCALHHIAPAARGGVFREAWRVLRPGGLMIVGEHNPWNPATRLVVSRCEMDRDAVLLRPHEVRTLGGDAGFEDLGRRYILMFPLRGRLFRTVERFFGAIPVGAQYIHTLRRPSS